MAYIPYEKMLKDHRSLYKLALATAQRANELNMGARSLVDVKGKKPTSIALEEFCSGKVRYRENADKKEKE